jgi:hypothetical protein
VGTDGLEADVLGGFTTLAWADRCWMMVRAVGFAGDVVGMAVDQLLLLEGEVVAVGAVSPKGWWEGVIDGPAPEKRRTSTTTQGGIDLGS